jgi:hypothetical protein
LISLRPPRALRDRKSNAQSYPVIWKYHTKNSVNYQDY